MNRYLLVNFDRKEYLRPEAFGESSELKAVVQSYEGILMALTALLSDSNGRGGGDLHTEHALIGSWAGCRIALIDDVATNAELSEPGMESTPLQRQILALGKDVSRGIAQVLINGEGEYCTLSQLNPDSLMPMTEQRKLTDGGRKLLLKSEGRNQPLHSLEQPFEVLGVGMGLTPRSAKQRLQQGIDKMAAFFAAPQRPTVLNISYEHGKKAVPDRRDSMTTKEGVTRLILDITSAAPASAPSDNSLVANRQVVIRLGAKGTTTKELFEQLLGVTEFDRPALLEGVTSPEVAKLLSMIPNLGA